MHFNPAGARSINSYAHLAQIKYSLSLSIQNRHTHTHTHTRANGRDCISPWPEENRIDSLTLTVLFKRTQFSPPHEPNETGANCANFTERMNERAKKTIHTTLHSLLVENAFPVKIQGDAIHPCYAS